MNAMAAQLRETYESKDTDELVELAGQNTLTDTAYAVLEEILTSRGVHMDMVGALRIKNAEKARLDEEKFYRLAPLSKRLLAKLIDTCGLLAVARILLMPLYTFSPVMANSIEGVLILAWFGYLLFKDGFNGQSIGKRIMKIQVVHTDTEKPCSLGQSFWRNLPNVFLFGWFFILGEKRMHLGDMMASTRVIKA